MRRELFLLCILPVVIFSFSTCKKMDSTYEKFIVLGGETYPERTTHLTVYAGHNRVKLSWLKGADPTVEKARISWNNNRDSIDVNISQSDKDTIDVIINGLAEGSYSFFITTYNKAGNVSVPVEVIAAVYGESYQQSLLPRPVNACTLFADSSISVDWGAANVVGGAFATEVAYTDTSGNRKTRRFSVSEERTEISGLLADSGFLYRTLYIPDSLSIDTFYTDYQRYGNFLLDKRHWTVVDFSTQFRTSAKYAATSLIDNTTVNGWFSGNHALPQYIVVDMGQKHTLDAFEVFRVKDDDRSYDTFELLVSDDESSWTSIGVFDFDYSNNAGKTYRIASPARGRYWKFVGLTGADIYHGIGEIEVYGF